MRRQEVRQSVAIEGPEKSIRCFTGCATQDATSFDSAEAFLGEASHHGEIVFGLAHDRSQIDSFGASPEPDTAALPAYGIDITLLGKLVDHLHQMGF
jgi:hypothetical protein